MGTGYEQPERAWRSVSELDLVEYTRLLYRVQNTLRENGISVSIEVLLCVAEHLECRRHIALDIDDKNVGDEKFSSLLKCLDSLTEAIGGLRTVDLLAAPPDLIGLRSEGDA